MYELILSMIFISTMINPSKNRAANKQCNQNVGSIFIIFTSPRFPSFPSIEASYLPTNGPVDLAAP